MTFWVRAIWVFAVRPTSEGPGRLHTSHGHTNLLPTSSLSCNPLPSFPCWKGAQGHTFTSLKDQWVSSAWGTTHRAHPAQISSELMPSVQSKDTQQVYAEPPYPGLGCSTPGLHWAAEAAMPTTSEWNLPRTHLHPYPLILP